MQKKRNIVAFVSRKWIEIEIHCPDDLWPTDVSDSFEDLPLSDIYVHTRMKLMFLIVPHDSSPKSHVYQCPIRLRFMEIEGASPGDVPPIVLGTLT